MQKLSVALALFLFSGATCHAEPFQLKPQYSPSFFKTRQKVIDPDKAVYGVPFGSTEGELLKAFGDPSGVIASSESVKVLMYGSSHMFVLKNGKLRELLIGDYVVDWRIAQRMEKVSFFDGGDWTLAPGINTRMNFEEIAAILKKSPAKPDYRLNYETRNAEVELQFSSMSENGQAKGYVLRGLSIRNHGN